MLRSSAPSGALADRDYQRRVWIEHEYPHDDFYDDLDTNIHILFDDSGVLPDPQRRVGSVILEREVPAFAALGKALDALIDRHGSADAATYLSDPEWDVVVHAASRVEGFVHSDQADDPG